MRLQPPSISRNMRAEDGRAYKSRLLPDKPLESECACLCQLGGAAEA